MDGLGPVPVQSDNASRLCWPLPPLPSLSCRPPPPSCCPAWGSRERPAPAACGALRAGPRASVTLSSQSSAEERTMTCLPLAGFQRSLEGQWWDWRPQVDVKQAQRPAEALGRRCSSVLSEPGLGAAEHRRPARVSGKRPMYRSQSADGRGQKATGSPPVSRQNPLCVSRYLRTPVGMGGRQPGPVGQGGVVVLASGS